MNNEMKRTGSVRNTAEKRCYTVSDLMSILCLSRASVYTLLKKQEFKWFRVGKCYRIPRTSFDDWLERQH